MLRNVRSLPLISRNFLGHWLGFLVTHSPWRRDVDTVRPIVDNFWMSVEPPRW
jgi:hypothetical protein